MSYHKMTIISGTTTAAENPYSCESLGRRPEGDEITAMRGWLDKHYKSACLHGHWSVEAAHRYAQKRGWNNVSMRHSTSDLSGKGRGSQDGEWRILPDGSAVKTGGFESVDDSAEINELWDEIDANDAIS